MEINAESLGRDCLNSRCVCVCLDARWSCSFSWTDFLCVRCTTLWIASAITVSCFQMPASLPQSPGVPTGTSTRKDPTEWVLLTNTHIWRYSCTHSSSNKAPKRTPVMNYICLSSSTGSLTDVSVCVSGSCVARMRLLPVCKLFFLLGATGSGMSSWIPVWMPSRRKLFWPSPPPSPSTSRRCSSSDPTAQARPSRWPRLSNTSSSSLRHGKQLCRVSLKGIYHRT